MKIIDRIKDAFDKAGKLAWDFVTDKNNDGDEKRALGVAAVIIGFVYGFRPEADAAILWAYFAFGGALLGVASLADKIPKKGE